MSSKLIIQNIQKIVGSLGGVTMAEMTGSNPGIFISYAREDVEYAEHIYYSLIEIFGVNRVFFDKKVLPGGAKWESDIKKAMKNSRHVIVVLSTTSVETVGFFQKEIDISLELSSRYPEFKRFLIPIRLDECDPSLSREKLSQFQNVNMFPCWKRGWNEILATMEDTPRNHLISRFTPKEIKNQGSDSRRYYYEHDQRLVEDIIASMRRSNELRILGISNRMFFENKHLYTELYNFCNQNKSVKVLCANPFATSVIKRTLFEEDSLRGDDEFTQKFFIDPAVYKNSDTFRDIDRTFNAYYKMFSSFENFKMKFYNDLPPMELVITNPFVIFKQIHYGDMAKDAYKDIPTKSVITKFELGGEDGMYYQLSNHFDFVWDDSANLDPKGMQLLYSKCENILRDKAVNSDLALYRNG